MATYTLNYNLDKYEGTDKPNLRDQYNSAMDKIDSALKAIDQKASQPATPYTGVTPVQVSGTQISVMNAGVGTSGVVTLTSDVNTGSGSTVPTTAAVKAYVDGHSGGGGTSGITNIVGTNGVTAQVSGSAATVSGQYASTSSPGVVNLATSVGSGSTSAVPTASAVKQYVDAHSGGGGTGGVTNVNASNGIQGSIQGSTLTLSGVEATPTTLGMVNKVNNITGGGTNSVPTAQAVIDYVAQQGGGGTGSGVTQISAGNGINVTPVTGTGAVTISANTATTGSPGIVTLATSGLSSNVAATASYVNNVKQSVDSLGNVIHQTLSGSAPGMTNMSGDVFIFTGLGIGIAMMYAQTSAPITPGQQKTYSYTIQSQYRPPQQAQVMRLYNHVSGSAILAQVRTDGTICWSCEGGSGADFVGAAVVTWAFEV